MIREDATTFANVLKEEVSLIDIPYQVNLCLSPANIYFWPHKIQAQRTYFCDVWSGEMKLVEVPWRGP